MLKAEPELLFYHNPPSDETLLLLNSTNISQIITQWQLKTLLKRFSWNKENDHRKRAFPHHTHTPTPPPHTHTILMCVMCVHCHCVLEHVSTDDETLGNSRNNHQVSNALKQSEYLVVSVLIKAASWFFCSENEKKKQKPFCLIYFLLFSQQIFTVIICGTQRLCSVCTAELSFSSISCEEENKKNHILLKQISLMFLFNLYLSCCKHNLVLFWVSDRL